MDCEEKSHPKREGGKQREEVVVVGREDSETTVSVLVEINDAMTEEPQPAEVCQQDREEEGKGGGGGGRKHKMIYVCQQVPVWKGEGRSSRGGGGGGSC